jgi:vacuolar-type H+-ATPase subunit I/STV1
MFKIKIMKALILSIVLLFSVSLVFSQDGMSPKEYKKVLKEWKKKKKRMSEEEFKDLVESNESMKSQISSMQKDLENAQSKLDAKDADIKKLKDENSRLKAQIAELSAKPKNTSPGYAAGNPNEGIVFKVQIGAFKFKSLEKYVNNNPNFSGEEDPDGTKKYTIGIFRDYWEADAFKKYMREMGVKDAWIVSYKDGVRVDIKDVLEGAVGGEPSEGAEGDGGEE